MLMLIMDAVNKASEEDNYLNTSHVNVNPWRLGNSRWISII